MESLLHDFINNEDVYIPTLVASGIVLIVTIKAVTGMIGKIANERTRREIAAYIAEGSMTPEQGERLLNSGKRRGCN
jgi:F0F1-type ATP synthase membrane subunit b/b'